MVNNNESFDIVIVGSGLLGQICALLCSKFNLKTLLISKNSINENALKEISFDDETARLLDSIGAYSKINDLINMPTYTDLVTTDSTIVQRSPVIKAKNSFPSLMTFIPGDLEKEMLKSCSEDPNIKVLDNFIISHFESGTNSYSLKNANSTIKVEAPFLICSDESDEFVNKKLNINYDDLGYAREWLIVDISLKNGDDLENVFRQICDPIRPTSYIALSEIRYRFQFQLLTGEKKEDMCSISKVHDLISNWLAPHQYNIEYLTTFEFKGRCANNFQTENIFLIGKAAYQIPPYAAQSLNSGIRDLVNLIWKINLITNYKAKDKIIYSYNVERNANIRQTIKSSIVLGQLIDSISVALQNNTPLEEAIAPEAREQAFGKMSKFSDDVNEPGIYNSLAHDIYTGQRIVKNLRDKNNTLIDMDKNIGFNFSIISKNNIFDHLEHDTVSKLKELGFKFLCNIQEIDSDLNLTEVLTLGDIIVRPDMKIFGVSSDKLSIEQMCQDLLSQIT